MAPTGTSSARLHTPTLTAAGTVPDVKELPEEIVARILKILGTAADIANDHRTTAAASTLLADSSQTTMIKCRSVCKTWRRICWPHFGTTVVIAERHRELEKFRNLVDDPRLEEVRQGVTHLVWDGSYYDQGMRDEAYDYHGSANRLGERQWRNPRREQEEIRLPNLQQQYFMEAIQRLPALEHVAFSGYQGCAIAGESYAELCGRLFGNTAWPDFPGADHTFHHKRLSRFLGAVRAIYGYYSAGNELEFNALPHVEVLRLPCIWIQIGLGYSYDNVENDGGYDSGGGNHDSNRQLDRYQRLKDHTSSKLRELEIGCDTRFSRGYHMMSRAEYDRWSAADICQPPHIIFRERMIPSYCNFENLQSITLYGFLFDTVGIRDFLLTYQRTLSIVRLIDCWSIDTYADFVAMIKEPLALRLSLIGAEIYNLQFMFAGEEDIDDDLHECALQENEQYVEEADEFSSEYPDKMRITRNLAWEPCRQNGRDLEFPKYSSRNCPCKWRDLENALLCGRQNQVLRQAQPMRTSEDRGNWYNIPVSCDAVHRHLPMGRRKLLASI